MPQSLFLLYCIIFRFFCIFIIFASSKGNFVIVNFESSKILFQKHILMYLESKNTIFGSCLYGCVSVCVCVCVCVYVPIQSGISFNWIGRSFPFFLKCVFWCEADVATSILSKIFFLILFWFFRFCEIRFSRFYVGRNYLS